MAPTSQNGGATDAGAGSVRRGGLVPFPFDGQDFLAALQQRIHKVLNSPEVAPALEFTLAGMLHRAGVLAWDPIQRPVPFWSVYSHCIVLRCAELPPGGDGAERVHAITGALNVDQILQANPAAKILDRAALARLAAQAASKAPTIPLGTYDPALTLSCMDAQDRAKDLPPEWLVRDRYAFWAKYAAAPFKLAGEMRANAEESVAAVRLDVPNPACFSFLEPPDGVDPRQWFSSLARRYALTLAGSVATQLAENGDVERVEVTAFDSVSFDRLFCTCLNLGDALALTGSKCTVQELDGLASSGKLEVALDADGWFEPVFGRVVIDDERVSPEWRLEPVELNDAPASEELRKASGARRVSDIGFDAHVPLKTAWLSLEGRLGANVGSATAALRETAAATNDPIVKEACARLSELLVNDTIDIRDPGALREAFLRGSDIAVAAREAKDKMLAGGMPARRVINRGLAGIRSVFGPDGLQDSAGVAYRAFASNAERIAFNKGGISDKREIRLIPYDVIQVYCVKVDDLLSSGETDEAYRIAKEVARIAPASPIPRLMAAQIAEQLGDAQVAFDHASAAACMCVGKTAAACALGAAAHYADGIGRQDLAAACLSVVSSWRNSINYLPSDFIDEIDASDGPFLIPPQQARELLGQEGIFVGTGDIHGREVLETAIACIQDGLFIPARGLLLTLHEGTGEESFRIIAETLYTVLER